MADKDSQPKLITAHGGGALVSRTLSGTERDEALKRAQGLSSITLDEYGEADLVMLATGGYSPLEGFMGPEDYERCVHELRLASGVVWSIPVVLPVSKETARDLREGQELALRGRSGEILGLMELQHKFEYDKRAEAREVYRTEEEAHPGVARLYGQGDVLLGGPVSMLNRIDDGFSDYWLDPHETRAAFAERGWQRVVAFQTRNPIHRAHEYLQKCALETVDGLLLHPLVGRTKSDDVSAEVRMQSYEVILSKYYPRDRVVLSVYPAFMRYGGPREALLHGLTRRNYGCTHFIVGRDAAGVGNYYGTYDAQKIFDQFDPAELGIQPIRFDHVFFCTVCGNMASTKTCPHDKEAHVFLSGTKVRELLRNGELPPPEFSRPEVARLLSDAMRAAAAS